MATSKPRITITLDQGVYDTIKGLAEVQGCSMSSIVSDLLETVDPVQRKVLAAIRGSLAVKKEAKNDLVKQLEHGQEEAEKAIGPLLKIFEMLGGLPPHSNTGVTNTPSLPQNSAEQPVGPCSTRRRG